MVFPLYPSSLFHPLSTLITLDNQALTLCKAICLKEEEPLYPQGLEAAVCKKYNYKNQSDVIDQLFLCLVIKPHLLCFSKETS